jgi:hypothetical protein
MATARVLGAEPNVFFASFDATVATQRITSDNVQSAQSDVRLVLAGAVNTTLLGNFISSPLKAATQGSPTTGDAQDKLLDELKLKLSSANIGTLATALANNQTTDAVKLTVTTLTTVPSTPPVANAGPSQNVVAGTTVTLDASASSAANGKSLTYLWKLESIPLGSTASLVSPTSAKPAFVTDVAGSYVASVIVNDGTTSSSAAATNIIAAFANVAPVANAGISQNVIAGAVVTLDGSDSSDANGDSLTYKWILTGKPSGSLATLYLSMSAKPIFNADIAGTYVGTLTVNDGKVNSTAATVSISASVANVPPVANAGVAQNIVTGSVVTLDGSTSSDANSDSLTYTWTLTSKPAGSSAALSSSTSPKPIFTAELAGIYVATLMVNDGKVNSATATVSVLAAVANVAPIANAGVSQSVITNTFVILDGSASSDANGDALSYVWTLTGRPVGSMAMLSSLVSAKPTFIADIAGTYVATLMVSDGKVGSTASTVSVTAAVTNVAPVANAGATQNVITGSAVTLDGSTSSDANGDLLAYAWTLTSKPAGSSAILSSTTIAKPSFTADAVGIYVGTLTVNDGKLSSKSVTVSVSVRVPFARSGSGDMVFDIPANVTRIRIQGTYTGYSSNFMIGIAGHNVVNELLGSVYSVTSHDGTYLIKGGGTVEITHSSGVTWSITEVPIEPIQVLSVPYSRAGIGDMVFDIPANVTRIRIQGTYAGSSSNFMIGIAGRNVVNELLGSSYSVTSYDGTYLIKGGGTVEIINSSGVAWSFAQLQ